ncbi:MAG: 3-hydroxyacyl-CoA dehydrogenase family protein [Deltaproteobacteria bacterium]|nr:3-hydroxyacyl-CoA dehydrogenase family protein [Deltaproteobacteria bacterium]
MEEIRKLAVIGAGLMGTGITQVAARAGFPVAVRDVEPRALAGAQAKIQAGLEKGVQKGSLSAEDAASALRRITFTTSLADALTDAEYVIEAVPENLALKRGVFEELDLAASPRAILATNTSELRIGSIASATARPDRVIGTHWFYPAPVMRLIEVIRGDATSDKTLATTLGFCRALGKETVVCRDSQGFITSRAISALLVECLRIHAEGVASIEDIDKAMRLGFNHPMGPFQLVDMSGLDVVFHNLEGLTEAYGERFRATAEMARLVKEGNLGQKTGRGFYPYR